MVRTTSVAVAPARDRAGELEADDPGDEHRHRLAEHGRLGLDAADAPAEDAQPVDHRRVAVGADAGVRVGDAVADHDRAGEVLDVDLVDDAGAGRDDLEVVEGGLAPAEELVALAVALVLDLDVALEGVGAAEDVDMTEWSMTSSAGASGLIFVASPPRSTTASRIVARSTTQGTPVKSCMMTRAGVNWISVSGWAFSSQPPRARMWSAVMLAPSSVRSRFSRSTLRLYGRRRAALHAADPVDLVGLLTDLQGAVGVEAVRAGHVGLLPLGPSRHELS